MAPAARAVTPMLARQLVSRLLAPSHAPLRLGTITLAAHQRDAVRRLRALLATHHGALLADEVGLGKTFVALAVAAKYRRPHVVHPAGLRGMWTESAARAGVSVVQTSYEALSRRAQDDTGFDLIVLDEAHHTRSPTALRYARIAALTAHADVLLLTATPIANRLDDLRSLLALFLGERARAMTPDAAAGLIVRRTSHGVHTVRLPRALPPQWVAVEDDGDVVRAIAALPPAVPPVGGGAADVLLRCSLLRQWASSGGALRTALQRRLARAGAMLDLLRAGRRLTRAAIAAWRFGDDAVQLAFPELCTEAPLPTGNTASLLDAVSTHAAAVRSLRELVDARDHVDRLRAAALRELRERHRGERLLAFTELAETVRMYRRHLGRDAGVGCLTASGGAIAGGRMNRGEMLRRFAPSGQRAKPVRAVEDVTLLVTTDLLAEGVDLRDATVVVHLDLPWSPARLEQRVGRARRLGAVTDRVAVYAFRPPEAAETLLALESRLRDKAALARVFRGAEDVLPVADASVRHPHQADAGALTPTERMSALLDRVLGWWPREAVDPASAAEAVEETVVSCVPSRDLGWLAVVEAAGSCQLAARIGDRIGDEVDLLEAAVRTVECADRGVANVDVAAALADAERWTAARCAESHFVMAPPRDGIARRLRDRLAGIQAGMPRDRRAAAADLLVRAYGAITAAASAGLEAELAALLADTTLGDLAWLREVAARARNVRRPGQPRVRVLIAFAPPAATSSRGPATRS